MENGRKKKKEIFFPFSFYSLLCHVELKVNSQSRREKIPKPEYSQGRAFHIYIFHQTSRENSVREASFAYEWGWVR